MTSTEFYRHILGLESPWSVSNVDLDMTANRVVVRVEIDRTTKWFHPETKEPATVHKWNERRWRHLDTCQFETVIEADVPSVKYRDGRIEEVAVPWADRYQRFTKLMEQAVRRRPFAVRNTRCSISGETGRISLSCMEPRGLQKAPRRCGC